MLRAKTLLFGRIPFNIAFKSLVNALRTDSKIKEGFLVGPQIRKIIYDNWVDLLMRIEKTT